jgi:hypothetical protein
MKELDYLNITDNIKIDYLLSGDIPRPDDV